MFELTVEFLVKHRKKGVRRVEAFKRAIRVSCITRKNLICNELKHAYMHTNCDIAKGTGIFNVRFDNLVFNTISSFKPICHLANREKSNLIGLRQTLTTSSAHQPITFTFFLFARKNSLSGKGALL
jgi:hypothetical protein